MSLSLGPTVLAAVLGVGLGFGAGRLLEAPALQSVVACLAAWVLASLLATVLWWIHPPADAEVLAVAWHLPGMLVAMAVVAAVALLIHAMMGAVAVTWPSILTWRPVLLGLLGALAGLWGYPGGAGLGEPLR